MKQIDYDEAYPTASSLVKLDNIYGLVCY